MAAERDRAGRQRGEWRLPAGSLYAGLAFLVLAAVVRRGEAMRAELATVV